MHRFSAVAGVLLLAAAVGGHPSPGVRSAGQNCKAALLGGEPIRYYSYHIHVLFWQNNADSVKEATALKAHFLQEFGVDPKAKCDDTETTHGVNPALCVVDDDSQHPACPFLTTEWAAFVPPENITAMIPFFTQNRGSLDIMIHPNSGCEVFDHVQWPMWVGNKWELDTSCLHYNCPGCDADDCKVGGEALRSHASDCDKVCSDACGAWLDNMDALASDCPHNCDLDASPTKCAAITALVPQLRANRTAC